MNSRSAGQVEPVSETRIMGDRFRQWPRARQVLRLAEIALFIAAGIGLLAGSDAWLQAAMAQHQAIGQIDTNPLEVNRSLWSASRIASFDAARKGASPSALGILSIPSISLEVAIFDGTSDRVLNLGAGRVPGTAHVGEPGNLAIAGHRDGFFRGLKDVEVGEEIWLRTSEEQRTRYRVTELRVVEPDDISVLQARDKRSLTLITCYPFYFVGSAPQRFIVSAEAVDSVSSTTADGD